jgi:hypothetical protein
VILYTPAASTPIQITAGGVSTTSGAVGSSGTYSQNGYGSGVAAQVQSSVAPVTRLNLSATTTVYLVGYCQFSVSTLTAVGSIRARRVR